MANRLEIRVRESKLDGSIDVWPKTRQTILQAVLLVFIPTVFFAVALQLTKGERSAVVG